MDDYARAAFANVISMGFNNVAIQSSHFYFASKQVTADQLKGSDKVFCEAALAAGAKNIEICRVYDRGGICREEIMSLYQMDNYIFTICYLEPEEEEQKGEEEMYMEAEEEDNEGDEGDEGDESNHENENLKRRREQTKKEEEVGWKKPRLKYDSIPRPAYDSGRLVAVNYEYRLGDTLFLATVAPQRLVYRGNEEVHVGNHGFEGEIFSNLAIIAHF